MIRLLAGALAGAAATVPMTLTMLWLHRLIPRNERRQLPPEQITENIAHDLGANEILQKESEKDLVSLINHFAFGATAGALYVPLTEKIGLPPIVKGVGYGLTVWAVSYLGWLPAAGLLSPATEHPAKQNAMMITAHVVWGSVLGLAAAPLIDSSQLGSAD